jgi:hypothetical protein
MRREKPVNEFQFGRQTVRTKVRLMSAPASERLDFDIMSFMPASMDDADDLLAEPDDQIPDITELMVWEG